MTQYWKSSERLSFHVMKIWWGASCGVVHRGEKTIRRSGPAFTAVRPSWLCPFERHRKAPQNFWKRSPFVKTCWESVSPSVELRQWPVSGCTINTRAECSTYNRKTNLRNTLKDEWNISNSQKYPKWSLCLTRVCSYSLWHYMSEFSATTDFFPLSLSLRPFSPHFHPGNLVTQMWKTNNLGTCLLKQK